MVRRFALASLVVFAIAVVGCTREKPPVTVPMPEANVAPVTATLATVSPYTPMATLDALGTPVVSANPTLSATLPSETAATSNPAVTLLPTTPGAATTYTVQWGDWLSKIAQRFGVTYSALLAANPGLDPNRIYPGQVINIPAGNVTAAVTASTAVSTAVTGASTPVASGTNSLPTTYTVQRGDWFYSIARKFNITIAALQEANPTVNPSFVYPGQVLNIPAASTQGGEGTPASSTGQTTYTVQQGDTLFSIAVRFNKTVIDLQIANHLATTSSIYPGQTLIIP